MPRGRPRKLGPSNPGKRFLKANKQAIVSVVKKEIRKESETKEKDLTYSALSLTSIGYGSSSINNYLVQNIAQGYDDGQRIGNKIHLQNIRFQFAFTAGDTVNHLRLLMLMPKTGLDYNANVQNLAQNVTTIASSGQQWLGLVDTDRYRVLYDKKLFLEYVPDTGSTSAVHAVTKFVSANIKINKDIEWAYSAAAAAVQPTTEVIFLCISDSSTVSHPGAIAGNLRLYYKDL